MELKRAQDGQLRVFEKEIGVSEKIREEQERANEKLKAELREIKMIIKVPRLHFKNIESIDFARLKLQAEDYEAKKSAFMTETGVDINKMRS